MVLLDKTYRFDKIEPNHEKFMKLLNNLYYKCLDEDDLKLLRTRLESKNQREARSDKFKDSIKMFHTRAEVMIYAIQEKFL